jgi:hypothetical protein
MNKGRVGEERRGKETDRCPLTFAPPVGVAAKMRIPHPKGSPNASRV